MHGSSNPSGALHEVFDEPVECVPRHLPGQSADQPIGQRANESTEEVGGYVTALAMCLPPCRRIESFVDQRSGDGDGEPAVSFGLDTRHARAMVVQASRVHIQLFGNSDRLTWTSVCHDEH